MIFFVSVKLFWCEMAQRVNFKNFFLQQSTKWWYLLRTHNKPIILAKESLTVQFSVFERLQFCCRMLLNVNGGQARAASTIFSKRSCNKFFQKCIKNFKWPCNSASMPLSAPIYGWCVWGTLVTCNECQEAYLKSKLILCVSNT